MLLFCCRKSQLNLGKNKLTQAALLNAKDTSCVLIGSYALWISHNSYGRCGLLLMTQARGEPDVSSKEFPFAQFYCRF